MALLFMVKLRSNMTESLKGCCRDSEKKNLTLNIYKCQFDLSQIDFMGHLLSAKGIGPDKSKIKAVTKARRPETVEKIKGFLGLVTIHDRFISDLATLSEPLRKLTK